MPGDPKWCELFLIIYRTPYSTKLKVNKTDAVTVSFQNLYSPADYHKHLIDLTVLEYSCVVIFEKKPGSSQPTTAAGAILKQWSAKLMY